MHHPPYLANCLPLKIQQNLSVSWLNAGSLKYTDPFFDETIARMKSLEENRNHKRTMTSLAEMEHASEIIDHVKPTAIIFHVSRCGSTLLSQLLGLNEKNIVLAEVPFFDDLLRWKYKNAGNDLTHLLPCAVRYYGQKRTRSEEQLFIKTDSWHLFFYHEWRRFYPNIPFILLYRRPDEVIRSQMKIKGMHAIPGIIEQAIFNLNELPGIENGHEVYMASVLEQYYTSMIKIANDDPNALLFNYNEGIDSIACSVMDITGIGSKQDQRMDIGERMKFNAKHPTEIFNEEAIVAEQKDHLCKPFRLYEQLEQIRIYLHEKNASQHHTITT